MLCGGLSARLLCVARPLGLGGGHELCKDLFGAGWFAA